MRIGVFQFSASENIHSNFMAISAAIARAAEQQVRLLVFQECALCGYPGQLIVLSSPLARKLWGSSAENTAHGFVGIWQELAITMNQKPSDKTISFAMKCLGLSLLMAGETAFDFAGIPIPVDIRVVAFTQRAGLMVGSEHEQVIALWDRVVHSLQEHQKSLSMIHLDSLVWQIASLADSELLRYFERIGASNVGQRLRAYLAQEKHEALAIEFPSSRLQTAKGRVVCFIPCCSSKNPSGEIISPRGLLGAEELPTTWPLLAKGRHAMEYCIDRGSKPTTALSLYNGAIYKPLSGIKREIVQQIAAGELRLYVISAGYGVLNALELAQSYDAVLQGAVAKQWRENGLSDIIAEIILSNNPSRVYGFFSGEVFWSAQSSSYRYFYTEGVKAALAKGLSADAGCFYREQGMGVQAILGRLGRTFAEFVVGGYDSEYVRNVEQRGRQDGDVKIGYRRIT